MDKKSNIEKGTGSLFTGIASTTVAVLGSSITPLAAFVPFLLQSIASGRHSQRIENALSEINKILAAHGDEIQNLSDPKYKLISESISAVFQSIDQQKIEFLKCAINNSITSDEITEKNTDLISRIIRDISVDEAEFLIKNFRYKYMFIGDGKNTEEIYQIQPHSAEEIVFHGLLCSGLVYSPVPVIGATMRYEFSPIVVKIIALLQNT